MTITTTIYLMITDTDDGTSVEHFTTETDRTDAYRAFCEKHWDAAQHGPMPHDPFVAYDRVAETSNCVTLSEIDLTALPEIAQLTSLLAEVIDTEPDCEGDVLLTLDRPCDLRARIHTALGRPWQKDQLFHGYRNVQRDYGSNDPLVWRSEFLCPDCGDSWTEEQVNQTGCKCPSCSTLVTPTTSTWIGPEDPASQALWNAAAA